MIANVVYRKESKLLLISTHSDLSFTLPFLLLTSPSPIVYFKIVKSFFRLFNNNFNNFIIYIIVMKIII